MSTKTLRRENVRRLILIQMMTSDADDGHEYGV